ncbi:MAG TPA: ATP-binding cassette domain-containing protein [Gaiellaceae bacterium]|jgi:peptide/nickel transport system ATP-binding protein
MSAEEIPVLEARGVSKVYRSRQGSLFGERREVQALADVSVQVRRGESLGIVGESGSGKSTLARLLLALEQPSEGEILFEGSVVSGRPERELAGLRRSVQVVFQDPMSSLDPRMRTRVAISEPLRALKIPGDHRARVRELLDAVGLPPEAADRYPHEFSGGQRQRIAIARALAPGPEVLLADEAVSALDVSVRAQVLNLLNRLIGEFGLTLVFISHDLSVIRYMCRRVVVLYRGRIVESGETEEVYERPQHSYTQALLAAIPRIGEPLGEAPPQLEQIASEA